MLFIGPRCVRIWNEGLKNVTRQHAKKTPLSHYARRSIIICQELAWSKGLDFHLMLRTGRAVRVGILNRHVKKPHTPLPIVNNLWMKAMWRGNETRWGWKAERVKKVMFIFFCRINEKKRSQESRTERRVWNEDEDEERQNQWGQQRKTRRINRWDEEVERIDYDRLRIQNESLETIYLLDPLQNKSKEKRRI